LEKYAADELVEGYFSAFLGKNKEVRSLSFLTYVHRRNSTCCMLLM